MKHKLSTGFKNKWVAALRSGNYKECSGVLFDGEAYDALGVAHRIVGVQPDQIKDVAFPTTQFPFLPKELLAGEGISDKISEFSDKGLSFKWIASYIERYL